VQLLELASRDLVIGAEDAAKLMQMKLVSSTTSSNRVRTMCQLLFRLIDPLEVPPRVASM
jgi:hypothetical protein